MPSSNKCDDGSSRTFYLKLSKRRHNRMNSRLETLRQLLEKATRNLSDDQLRWRREGKWCVAEILEHLRLTYTGTIKGLERVLQMDKPQAATPSFRHRLRTLVVLGLNYMPQGRKAPKQTVPRGLPSDDIKADIASSISAMDDILTKCEARFGTGKLLDHPILGPLTARQWRAFHLIHGRHHVKQIERLRARMGA
jgi:hypothetical protein